MRKRKITQRQLLWARVNIEFWGKGLGHVYRANRAYRIMCTWWPCRGCCELSSVNRRECYYLHDMCVQWFKCK